MYLPVRTCLSSSPYDWACFGGAAESLTFHMLHMYLGGCPTYRDPLPVTVSRGGPKRLTRSVVVWTVVALLVLSTLLQIYQVDRNEQVMAILDLKHVACNLRPLCRRHKVMWVASSVLFGFIVRFLKISPRFQCRCEWSAKAQAIHRKMADESLLSVNPRLLSTLQLISIWTSSLHAVSSAFSVQTSRVVSSRNCIPSNDWPTETQSFVKI